MRTVYIIVEGPTEEEFITNSVAPYLKGFGIINTVPIPVETSPGYYGGDISYSRYRNNAEKLLISDPIGMVTSLIDYYEIRSDFPGYSPAIAMPNKVDSVQHIEREISANILNPRLIPYIQLHEFEALLFSNINGFQNWFPKFTSHFQYIQTSNTYP